MGAVTAAHAPSGFPAMQVARDGRGRRTNRTLIVCALIAAALHIPATPYGSLLGRFWTDDSETEDEGEAVVPLSLEIDLTQDETNTPPKITPPPPPKPEPPKPEPPKRDELVLDKPKVEEPPPVIPENTEPAPKPEDTAPAKPKLPETPIADLKVAMQLTPKNSNHVQVVLVGANLRKNSVGARLGTLFATLPDWQGFFAGNAIDPINDVDAIILTGPRFRVTGKVLAILQFAKPMATVHDTVDKLVTGGDPKGRWIDGAPVEAALATVDDNERLFALVPDSRLLYVIPSPYPSESERKKLEDKDKDKLDERLDKAKKQTDDQLKRVKRATFNDYTKADFAIDAYMSEPYKLIGKPGKEGTIELPLLGEIEILPKSIKGGRITVVPAGDDAIVTLTGEAKDEDEAKLEAEHFTSLWPTASMAASAKYDLSLPDLKFVAEGKTIKATATVPAATLERMLAIANEYVEDLKKKRAKKT
ncbi:MAG: hypothetical protein U0271_25220 [Polyangiaceae bacterium]